MTTTSTNAPNSTTITTIHTSTTSPPLTTTRIGTTTAVATTTTTTTTTSRPSQAPSTPPTMSSTALTSTQIISTTIPHPSSTQTPKSTTTTTTASTQTTAIRPKNSTSSTNAPTQTPTGSVLTQTPTRITTTRRPTPSQKPQPPDGDTWTVVVDYTIKGTTTRLKDNDTVRLIFADLLGQNLSVPMSTINVNVKSYHRVTPGSGRRRVLLATQFQFFLNAHIHIPAASSADGRNKIVLFESQKPVLTVALQQKLGVIKLTYCKADAILRVEQSQTQPTEPTVSVWTVIAWLVGGIGVVALVCLGGLICHRRMHADINMFTGDDPNDPNAGINLDRLLDPQIPLIDDVLMSTPHDDQPWLTPGTSGGRGSAAAFYRPNDDDDEEDQRFTRLV